LYVDVTREQEDQSTKHLFRSTQGEINMIVQLYAMRWMMAVATVVIAGGAIAADPSSAPNAGSQSRVAESQPAARNQIDPLADRLVRRTCATLADSNVFTFHAEITFDQVLPSSEVKLQFAAVTDYAVRKPGALAVDYESDLGAKRFWYDGGTLTIFDASKEMYASKAVAALYQRDAGSGSGDEQTYASARRLRDERSVCEFLNKSSLVAMSAGAT
jgi:Predicted periplasmic protein (DUF2092)